MPGGHGKGPNSPAHLLPLDERPIVTRDHRSPDERLGEMSGEYGEGGLGGVTNSHGSPPMAKPRILHSAEGLRNYPPRENQTIPGFVMFFRVCVRNSCRRK